MNKQYVSLFIKEMERVEKNYAYLQESLEKKFNKYLSYPDLSHLPVKIRVGSDGWPVTYILPLKFALIAQVRKELPAMGWDEKPDYEYTDKYGMHLQFVDYQHNWIYITFKDAGQLKIYKDDPEICVLQKIGTKEVTNTVDIIEPVCQEGAAEAW